VTSIAIGEFDPALNLASSGAAARERGTVSPRGIGGAAGPSAALAAAPTGRDGAETAS
jgi:hypothetical protein